MFTYYTIIGKNLELLEGHLDNVINYAGFNKIPNPKEIIVIVYKNDKIPLETTDSILSSIKDHACQYVIYQEPTDNFLENLYACWNLGYQVAKDGWVFRGGSDQIFSKDSFVSLSEAAKQFEKQNVILQANTIEHSQRAFGSRHMLLDLGASYENFDYNFFEEFIKVINKDIPESILDIEQAKKYWGYPTPLRTSLGTIDRCDGCSWLMKKSDWEKFGPMPPIVNGVTGDVLIHDKMQEAGYKDLIVKDCVTYHFVKGESSG